MCLSTWMTSMSCRRSSPCLKIIPTGVRRLGDGMGQNSSHSGFFLEAITLHLSSWKREIAHGGVGVTSHVKSIQFRKGIRKYNGQKDKVWSYTKKLKIKKTPVLLSFAVSCKREWDRCSNWKQNRKRHKGEEPQQINEDRKLVRTQWTLWWWWQRREKRGWEVQRNDSTNNLKQDFCG